MSSSPGRGLPERWVGIAWALSLTALVDLLTNVTPAVHDGNVYLRMAEGWGGQGPWVAPFAYRPAVPFLVHATSQLTGVSADVCFLWFTRLSVAALLLAVFRFLRWASLGIPNAMWLVGVVALSFAHAKFPLFFYTLVDSEANLLMFVAMWAFVARRFVLCFLLGCAGLFFKEFLIIPPMLVVVRSILAMRSGVSTAGVSKVVCMIGAVGACVLVPRLAFDVSLSFQSIDPIINPASLKRLYETPLSWRWDLNFVVSWVSYWLPFCLLLTRERLAAAWRVLGDFRTYCVIHLVSVAVLTMYGGSNLFSFVSYSLFAQVMLMRNVLAKGVLWPERVYVVVALFFYNRIWMDVPLPAGQRQAFRDFVVGGFGANVNVNTGSDVLELLSWIAGAVVVRWALAKWSNRDRQAA